MLCFVLNMGFFQTGIPQNVLSYYSGACFRSAVMHSVVEMGMYSPAMTVFTDAGLTEAVDRTTEVHSEQKLWVELSAGPMAGDRVAMVIDSCRVTNKRSSSYNLIMDG